MNALGLVYKALSTNDTIALFASCPHCVRLRACVCVCVFYCAFYCGGSKLIDHLVTRLYTNVIMYITRYLTLIWCTSSFHGETWITIAQIAIIVNSDRFLCEFRIGNAVTSIAIIGDDDYFQLGRN